MSERVIAVVAGYFIGGAATVMAISSINLFLLAFEMLRFKP